MNRRKDTRKWQKKSFYQLLGLPSTRPAPGQNTQQKKELKKIEKSGSGREREREKKKFICLLQPL